MKISRFFAVLTVILLFSLTDVYAEDNENETVTLYDNGYRGEGMVIAILDNEFDYRHDMFALSDDTVPKLTEDDVHNIIKAGLNCSAAVINKGQNPYISSKIPFAFDYVAGKVVTYSDSISTHGTHVAGILSANNTDEIDGGFDGIAPEAQIILMKISASNGALSAEAIYSAFEDALKLGADVVNCSFGSDSGYIYGGLNYLDTINYELTGVIYESMVDLAAAVGNASRTGSGSVYDTEYGIDNPLTINPDYGTAGEPSIYPHNIAVANAGIFKDYRMILSDGSNIIYTKSHNEFYDSLKLQTLEYVLIPNIGEKSDYKNIKEDLTGKIAVVERGIITFDEKIKAAYNAGAAGVIVYNNIPGELDFTPVITFEKIPCIVITQENGRFFTDNKETLKSVHISECDTEKDEIRINPLSAWGATGMLTLKPDITAFGTEIYSTAVNNEYSRMTGSSMASPVISGAAAIVKQYLKANGIEIENESFIRRYLMTMAEPIVNPDNGVEYSPREQGSGLISKDNLIALDVVLWNEESGETKIELGDMITDTFEINFIAHNLSDIDRSYTIDTTLMTDGYFYHAESKQYFTSDYSEILKYSEITADDIITIPAGETIEITVTAKLDPLDINKYKRAFIYGFFVEGFVYLVPTDGGTPASIPFMGYYGDWSDVPVTVGGYYDSIPFTVSPVLGTSWSSEIDYANDIGMYLTRDVIINKVEIQTLNSEVLEKISNNMFSEYYMKMITSESDYIYKNAKYWDGRDTANWKYVYPDGEYKMVVSYAIPYKPDIEKILEIPFIIDSIAPSLIDYTINIENGILHVKVSDDNYVHAVILDGISTYTDIKKNAEADIDISYALGTGQEAVYIYIVDVAGNIKIEKIIISR